jgi:hypothetical protein
MNFTEYYGYNYDFIHPLVPGHRAIADMVLYALQVCLDCCVHLVGVELLQHVAGRQINRSHSIKLLYQDLHLELSNNARHAQPCSSS